jgi:hypothetical protein
VPRFGVPVRRAEADERRHGHRAAGAARAFGRLEQGGGLLVAGDPPMESAVPDGGRVAEHSWRRAVHGGGPGRPRSSAFLVPRVGIEPTLLAERDFESRASTNFATEAGATEAGSLPYRP